MAEKGAPGYYVTLKRGKWRFVNADGTYDPREFGTRAEAIAALKEFYADVHAILNPEKA